MLFLVSPTMCQSSPLRGWPALSAKTYMRVRWTVKNQQRAMAGHREHGVYKELKCAIPIATTFSALEAERVS